MNADTEISRWLGDPARIAMSKAVVEEILNNDLVGKAVRSSSSTT